MTESLTNNLAQARNEILSLRRDIENRQYLHQGGGGGGSGSILGQSPMLSMNLRTAGIAAAAAAVQADPYGSTYNSGSSGADSPSLTDQQNKHRNQHQKARCAHPGCWACA